MFLKFLRSLFGKKTETAPTATKQSAAAAPAKASAAEVPASAATVAKPAAEPEKTASATVETVVPTVVTPAPEATVPVVAAPDAEALRQAALEAARIEASKDPEVLCGVNAKMSPVEIENRLAALYRRHNRAASSLNEEMREEAEHMLESIAICRERLLRGR